MLVFGDQMWANKQYLFNKMWIAPLLRIEFWQIWRASSLIFESLFQAIDLAAKVCFLSKCMYEGWRSVFCE